LTTIKLFKISNTISFPPIILLNLNLRSVDLVAARRLDDSSSPEGSAGARADPCVDLSAR